VSRGPVFCRFYVGFRVGGHITSYPASAAWAGTSCAPTCVARQPITAATSAVPTMASVVTANVCVACQSGRRGQAQVDRTEDSDPEHIADLSRGGAPAADVRRALQHSRDDRTLASWKAAGQRRRARRSAVAVRLAEPGAGDQQHDEDELDCHDRRFQISLIAGWRCSRSLRRPAPKTAPSARRPATPIGAAECRAPVITEHCQRCLIRCEVRQDASKGTHPLIGQKSASNMVGPAGSASLLA
jgi:hypothetical protein